MHAELAQMVLGDVRDHCDVRPLHGEPASEDAAPGGFEYRGLDPPVAKQQARTLGTGVVAAGQRLPGDGHAIGGRLSRHATTSRNQRREEPHRGGLPVRPGDQHHGHIVNLPPGNAAGRRQLRQRPGARPRAESDRHG